MNEKPDTFNFELVSPERKVMAEQAWQVTIPGEEGMFGVRAGHASLVAAIKPGLIEVISRPGDAAKKFFIGGGFADVTATNCTVLAEETAGLGELNSAVLEQDKNAVLERLKLVKDPVEKARFERKLALIQAKLDAVAYKNKKAA